jgi:L-asparaginase
MDYTIYDNMLSDKRDNVVILSTGGTIAGKGESGKSSGYESGVIDVQELCAGVQGLEELANIVPIKVCSVDSCDMSYNYIKELYRAIMHFSDSVSGFVITHGTDTMAETAYLLSMAEGINKPVVITGSMRPSSARVYDGNDNLYNAVALAVADCAKELGVVAVIANMIFDGRLLDKCSTFRLEAFGQGDMGALGYISDGKATVYNRPVAVNKLKLPDSLPPVAVVHFSTDADTALLEYALKKYDGVVLAGAGDGGISTVWLDRLKLSTTPVLRCSKVKGYVHKCDRLDVAENIYTCGNLSPDKARLLMQLLLADKIKLSEIEKYI